MASFLVTAFHIFIADYKVKTPWQGHLSFLKDVSVEPIEPRFCGADPSQIPLGRRSHMQKRARTWAIPPASTNPPMPVPNPAVPSLRHAPSGPAPQGPKAKTLCWCPPPVPMGAAWRGRKSLTPGAGPTLGSVWGAVGRICLRGSCTSCRCKLRDVSAIKEQT